MVRHTLPAAGQHGMLPAIQRMLAAALYRQSLYAAPEALNRVAAPLAHRAAQRLGTARHVEAEAPKRAGGGADGLHLSAALGSGPHIPSDRHAAYAAHLPRYDTMMKPMAAGPLGARLAARHFSSIGTPGTTLSGLASVSKRGASEEHPEGAGEGLHLSEAMGHGPHLPSEPAESERWEEHMPRYDTARKPGALDPLKDRLATKQSDWMGAPGAAVSGVAGGAQHHDAAQEHLEAAEPSAPHEAGVGEGLHISDALGRDAHLPSEPERLAAHAPRYDTAPKPKASDPLKTRLAKREFSTAAAPMSTMAPSTEEDEQRRNPVTGYHMFGRESFPKKSTREAAAKTAELWKSLSSDDQLPYLERAERMQKEYDEAMEAYRGSSREALWAHIPGLEDPGMPRRPKSAFMLFAEEMGQPVAEGAGGAEGEISWSQWVRFSDSDKARHKLKAEALRADFEKRRRVMESRKRDLEAQGDFAEAKWYDSMATQIGKEEQHLHEVTNGGANSASMDPAAGVDAAAAHDDMEPPAKSDRAVGGPNVRSRLSPLERMRRSFFEPAFFEPRSLFAPLWSSPAKVVDPERPRRPKTALKLFQEATALANPMWTSWQAHVFADFEWDMMSDEARAPYVREAGEEAKKYEEAMTEYKSSGKQAAWEGKRKRRM